MKPIRLDYAFFLQIFLAVFDFNELSHNCPNPAKDYITVEFDQIESAESLPDESVLLSEKSTTPVKNIDVQNLYQRNGLKNGKQIEIDAKALPRGTYYLHIKNSRLKENKVDVVKILLK